REGPRAGPWWVRLPLSSATLGSKPAMTPAPSFLDELKRATERATAAESDFRREVAQRIEVLESERAFAFRRYNLIRAVAEAVASAESEEIAVAGAAAIVRAKLGWASDSEARDAVVSRFAPVAQAMFASLAPRSDDQDASATPPDVVAALTDF